MNIFLVMVLKFNQFFGGNPSKNGGVSVDFCEEEGGQVSMQGGCRNFPRGYYFLFGRWVVVSW